MRAIGCLLLALTLAGRADARAQTQTQEPAPNEPSPANGPELRQLTRTLARAAASARAAVPERSSRAGRDLAARLDDYAKNARSLAEKS